MALIGQLGLDRWDSQLLPRRQHNLVPGQVRTFPPAVLRPGDLVVCRSHGVRVKVAIGPGQGEKDASSGPIRSGLRLELTHHADTSVSARCSRRAS